MLQRRVFRHAYLRAQGPSNSCLSIRLAKTWKSISTFLDSVLFYKFLSCVYYIIYIYKLYQYSIYIYLNSIYIYTHLLYIYLYLYTYIYIYIIVFIYLEHRMTSFFSYLTEYCRIWRNNHFFWPYANIWQYLATSGMLEEY